ncbi:MAG: DUF2147 domain-containing protein [Bacteroidales bacterium]|nr:DUF2147 domain-containing protein [Bacteroidales bacterium]
MKRILLTLTLLLMGTAALLAQGLNDKADNILGNWRATRGGEVSKVKVSRSADGTYMAQVYWVEVDKDKNGNKKLDRKNPDKSLRSTPCDQIVLIKGLKYNAEKKQWDGTEVYDPTKGIRAKCVVRFEDDGRLRIKGSILGISQSAYWEKLSE